MYPEYILLNTFAFELICFNSVRSLYVSPRLSLIAFSVLYRSPRVRRAAAQPHGEFDNDLSKPGCARLWLSGSAQRDSFADHLPLPCAIPPERERAAMNGRWFGSYIRSTYSIGQDCSSPDIVRGSCACAYGCF